ncbi:uncharacterized protein V6R79_013388 [Siganus canaliculatus]
MKVLLVMVLLLLCSTQVLTLKCYTCGGPNDRVCQVETECASNAEFCKTVENAEGAIASRSCEQDCFEDDFTTCCEGDLCEA